MNGSGHSRYTRANADRREAGLPLDEKAIYASYTHRSDSSRQIINCYAVHDDGSLGEKQDFASVKKGVPDGLVVSEDGRLWVALADGGHGVAVYNANGAQSSFIEIDQPMCTSVCFGGEDMKSLYIVSGSDGASCEKAGAIYRIRTDVAGCPIAPARVKLGVL